MSLEYLATPDNTDLTKIKSSLYAWPIHRYHLAIQFNSRPGPAMKIKQQTSNNQNAYDQPANTLKIIQEEIKTTEESISQKEGSLKKLSSEGKGFFSKIIHRAKKLAALYLFTIILLILNAAFGSKDLIMPIILFVLFKGFIFDPVRVIFIKNNIKELKQKVVDLRKSLLDLSKTLLVPEIHSLGAATTQDIKRKTAAKFLTPQEIQIIMEHEVNNGEFERIPLNNNDILYKSSHHVEGGSNIKTIHLELDLDD